MATISGTPNSSDASVSLTAGSLAGITSLSITRNDPDGISRPVRSATDVQTGGATTMAFFDFECPLEVDVTYTLTPNTGSPVTSGLVYIWTNDEGTIYWLKNVASAPESRIVNVQDMSAIQRKARILGQYDVLGRSNPVVVSDVRGGRTGTFTLYTDTVDEAAGVRNLLATGFVLFLQCPYAVDFPDMYFIAGDAEELRHRAMGPERTWTVPFIEVDAPTDDLVAVGSNSWALVVQFGTWLNVKNKRSTWLDVLNLPYTTADAP